MRIKLASLHSSSTYRASAIPVITQQGKIVTFAYVTTRSLVVVKSSPQSAWGPSTADTFFRYYQLI